MHALLAQLAPAPADARRNLATVRALLEAHPEADLAVFPELFLQGYDPERAAALAVSRDDPLVEEMCAVAAANDTALVIGFAERTDREPANALACIDRDGTLAATYRKAHLFGERESAAFVAGDALVVTHLAGVAVGVLLCFDVEFPEVARSLARAGAHLLVTAAANMDPYGPDHALAVRARALDNRLHHLYANRCGAEAGLVFIGGSAAIAPDGSVVAIAGRDEDVVTVDLDPERRDDVSAEVDYLLHLRTDLVVDAPPHVTRRGGSR